MLRKAVDWSIAGLAGIVMLAVAAVAVPDAHQARAEAGFDRAEIEEIIHDYIMDNAEIILQSVEQYQRYGQAERQREALKDNRRHLFENPNTPVGGNPDGDISVLEFFDYNCGFCKRAWTTLEQLMREDENVRVVFKEYPILGEASELAARWALAARNQGKYVEMHAALMEHNGRITERILRRTADNIGLDVTRLSEDAQSDEITEIIQMNRALARQMGITGTPAFLVEDQVISGAVPLEHLQEAIAEERRKKR